MSGHMDNNLWLRNDRLKLMSPSVLSIQLDRPIGLITNQYSSTAHCPLLFLCGCFGNSFVKGASERKSSKAFNPLMWKQQRKPRTRLRENSTAVLQFVRLSLNKERLLSGLLHFTFRLCVLGCLSISTQRSAHLTQSES